VQASIAATSAAAAVVAITVIAAPVAVHLVRSSS